MEELEVSSGVIYHEIPCLLVGSGSDSSHMACFGISGVKGFDGVKFVWLLVRIGSGMA